MRGRGKSGKQQVPATDPLPVMGNARFSPWMLDTRGSFEAWNLRYEPVRAQFSASGFGLDVVGTHGVEPETGIFRLPSSLDIEHMPSPHPLLDRLPTLDAFLQAKREAERPKTAPATRSWVPKGPWPPPLTKLQVWNPVYGALIFENLPTPNPEEGERGLTVGDLKRMVYERLLLPPTLTLTLSAYGRVLEDQSTLEAVGLANGCKLDLSTTLRRNPHQSLHRVRVNSTALRTRQLAADASTTVLDLKHAFSSSLANSEHVWFTKEGLCIRRAGTTILANATHKADEKAGTSAVSMGEEIICPNMIVMRGGKGGGCTCFKVQNGRPIQVVEAMIVELIVPPDQMWLSWRGRCMQDHELLFEVGVRTDDEVVLEFVSPVSPPVLTLLRKPAEAPKAKGGKKGKGKKKK